MGTRGEATAVGYVAVIGDIRRSRHIAERGLLQEQLETALGGANERFAADVAAGFVLTLGDEFQGLLLRPGSVVDVVTALDAALEGCGTCATGSGGEGCRPNSRTSLCESTDRASTGRGPPSWRGSGTTGG